MHIVLMGFTWAYGEESTHPRGLRGHMVQTASFLAQWIAPDHISLLTNHNDVTQPFLSKLPYQTHTFFFRETPQQSSTQLDLPAEIKSYPDHWPESWVPLIKQATLIVVDLFRPDWIRQIVQINPHAALILEGSSWNLPWATRHVGHWATLLKINRLQAADIVGFPIFTVEDMIAAQMHLKSLGVTRGIITLTKEGAFYFDPNSEGLQPARVLTRKSFPLSGDAFLAGVIYAFRVTRDMAIITNQGLEKSGSYIRQQIPQYGLK